MTLSPLQTYDFDVALSFAGEDRGYVQQVAELLNARGVRIFYDEYMAAELWGNDLYVVLDEVYRRRARFTVAFVSASYVSKPWTRHERQSAQARALTEEGAYFLPVYLDGSELPGLRPTIGYIDARRTSVERLVDLVEQKLTAAPGAVTEQAPVLRSPRSAIQQRELLARRPVAWEYLLYAGALWQRREALESKWLDHELGYGRRTGQHFDAMQATACLENAMSDLGACGDNLLKMFDPTAQERAFGKPGEPGNPILIEHIATRFVGEYEQMLDTAAALRGVGVPDNIAPLMEAAARLTDTPLREIRAFIDQLIVEIDSIPDRLSTDKSVMIELTLTLTIDKEALIALERAVSVAKRGLGIG